MSDKFTLRHCGNVFIHSIAAVAIFILCYQGNIFPQTETMPSGSGTSSDPYLIATLDNLAWLQDAANDTAWGAYYQQTADIDADSTSSWDSGAGFSPIGNSTKEFTGTYDGQGYTIDNLYISRGSTNYIGFFGEAEYGAIENIGIINENVTGSNNTGGLVGEEGPLPPPPGDNPYIDSCYCTGSVTGKLDVGGLVGSNFSPVNYCYSTVSVINNTQGSGVNGDGGLLGYNLSTVSQCYSAGSISSNVSYVGGLVGYNRSTVSNCYSTESVNDGSGSGVGGLVGYNENTTSNCYSKGHVSGKATGGLVGSAGSSSQVNSCFWDTTTSGQSTSAGGGTGESTTAMETASTFFNAGWSASIWYIDSGVNNGYPYLAWQNTGGSPLPVELTTFTANNFSGKVELQWNTATEVNNYGFEIQRSAVSGQRSDGGQSPFINSHSSFSKIGFVKGAGNSNSPKNYSFIDDNPPSGTVEYRLKQIDNNGGFKYSQILTVSSLPTKFELSQNYPNPFNPTTTIQYALPKAEHVTLKVYDELGQEVSTLVNEQQQAGNYSVQLTLRSFSEGGASGVYYYRISAGDFTEVKKLMLLKCVFSVRKLTHFSG